MTLVGADGQQIRALQSAGMVNYTVNTYLYVIVTICSSWQSSFSLVCRCGCIYLD